MILEKLLSDLDVASLPNHWLAKPNPLELTCRFDRKEHIIFLYILLSIFSSFPVEILVCVIIDSSLNGSFGKGPWTNSAYVMVLF